MNRFTQGAIGLGLSAASFGVGGSTVEAGSALPGNCTVYEIGEPVVESAESALLDAGFMGIKADGAITSTSEQLNVYNAQRRLKEAGIMPESTRICGYAGDATRIAAEIMISSRISSTADSNNSNASSEAVTLVDCSRYDEYSVDTIKNIQRALGAYADGKFGNQSCRALIDFQEDNGLAQYGLGALGTRTANALGVRLVKKAAADNGAFEPAEDCPSKNSCEIYVDLGARKAYISKNDGVKSTASGDRLFEFSVQSGKPGKETNTGNFRLGGVEYGANNNPWRTSTLGSSNGEPNLYKFRRLNPLDGSDSGEGIHGSQFYGMGKGSSGCLRTRVKTQDVVARLPADIPVLIVE